MKLLIRGSKARARAAMIARHLTTDWTVAAWGADEPPAALADADALLAMHYDAAMPPAPKLRLLQLPGAGFDAIDFAAVPASAAICNVYGHETGIAEYVFAAMLEWVTGLSRMDARLRAGDWRDSLFLDGPVHGELAGATLGLVGYGHIGREVARRARAFGLRVIAATRSPEKRDDNVDAIGGMETLGAMLGEADFVVVACPLVDQTRGLIGAAELAAMKPTAVLINVARGAVVDEDALYAACRERAIAGAVIDVWYRYPERPGEPVMPSKHPFQTLDNVYMTPHASGWTEGLMVRRAHTIAANLDRLARGEPLRNLLRPARAD
ncbi:MAG: 2-hydroxyacid dehydrogenase [Alphaproteobacteria bacterium]